MISTELHGEQELSSWILRMQLRLDKLFCLKIATRIIKQPSDRVWFQNRRAKWRRQERLEIHSQDDFNRIVQKQNSSLSFSPFDSWHPLSSRDNPSSSLFNLESTREEQASLPNMMGQSVSGSIVHRMPPPFAMQTGTSRFAVLSRPACTQKSYLYNAAARSLLRAEASFQIWPR
ncbi:hypothetical protein D918_05238 [Trichuris suis]|nr:hypothetical protein D918_05238 [Trichuris suis]